LNPDIFIHKIDESFMKVECEPSIAKELEDYFSFYAENYRYHPKFKARVWDGKLFLFSSRTHLINVGLLGHFPDFCKERHYSLGIDERLLLTNEFSIHEAKEFVKTLNLPLEVRDYQLESFVKAIRNKRRIIISSTGSGKSLILYLIVRYLQTIKSKGLLIVPTVSLTQQMFKDFRDYGYDAEKYCHVIYSGKDKVSDKFLYISTWQSLINIKKGNYLDKQYFEQFEFLISDEIHLSTAASLTAIINACTKAEYKIGVTGTLADSKVNELALIGLVGPIYRATTTADLIEKKYLAEFSIKSLILKHPESICKASKKWSYQDEMNYLISNEKRNIFIKNLTLSLSGTTLLLFQFVEKHGKILFEMIQREAEKNRRVFFVYGGTDVEVRESIRAIAEKESDAIIIASYQIYSTGINLKNLHNIIFASPSKSRIRNLQSIGRGLRIGENKKKATLFDIADDLRVGEHVNITLKHYLLRLKIYNEERFPYKTYTVELK